MNNNKLKELLFIWGLNELQLSRSQSILWIYIIRNTWIQRVCLIQARFEDKCKLVSSPDLLTSYFSLQVGLEQD